MKLLTHMTLSELMEQKARIEEEISVRVITIKLVERLRNRLQQLEENAELHQEEIRFLKESLQEQQNFDNYRAVI